jgi:hypothetical protein
MKSPGNLRIGGESTAGLVEWVGRDELRLRGAVDVRRSAIAALLGPLKIPSLGGVKA